MTLAEPILCLDTSTSTARVAILDAAAEVRFSTEATADRHSSHVLALCAAALEAVGARPAELAAIACGGGPGSFTGLRVGLAVAKGLALPTGVPLFLVSSLEALALDILDAANPETTAVPCLDAGKGEVYVGAFVSNGDALVLEARAACRLPAGDVASWLGDLSRPLLAGNGLVRHQSVLGALPTATTSGPTARSIGRLALRQRARGEASDLERAVPFYGRPPDITMKKPRG
jgi:tRNA threonylcarbamoyladenosine biosynthesis protein TsaB